MTLTEIKVPDIGEVTDVSVIELMVKVGDTIKAEQSLITVESDKASEDSVLLLLEVASADAAPSPAPASAPASNQPVAPVASAQDAPKTVASLVSTPAVMSAAGAR